MASIRRVRRAFRKDAHQLISSGDGSREKLMQAAGHHFGHDVGYEVLIKTFLQSEVSNAMATLQRDGLVETIGGKWMPVAALQAEDVDIISLRRLKRLRGELKAQERLAHQHGRIDDAVTAARVLEIISHSLESRQLQHEEAEVEAPVGR